MKYYIALGGVGCRTVKEFAEKNNIDSANCYYLDVTSDVLFMAKDRRHAHIVESLPNGTGTLRAIGKNAVRYEIYSNRLYDFFKDMLDDSEAELILVTTSFGGFGSVACVEIAEYLQALLWKKNRKKKEGFCKIIAFNEAYTQNWQFARELLDRFQFNTIETVKEISVLNPVSEVALFQISPVPVFNPAYRTYLIDTARLPESEFYKILDRSDAELQKYDVKQKYLLKTNKNAPYVFISYSAADQKTADMLADQLEENGISCWIATRSIREGSYAKQILQGINGAKIFVVLISRHSMMSEHVKNEIDRAFSRLKDGMKIIPVILDEARLDEECAYYLCRQEFFFAKQPPVEKRIGELVSRIQQILE